MNINKSNNIRINENILQPFDKKLIESANNLAIEKAKTEINTRENFVVSLKKWELSSEQSITTQVKWELSRIPLSYYIYQEKGISGFEKIFLSDIERCFWDWSRASLGKIRFYKVYDPKISDITIKWIDNPEDNRPLESGKCVRKLVGNKIDKAEIEVVLFPLIDLKSPLIDRNERIRRTLLHEIGHSLGLEHSLNASDIMFHRGIKNRKLSDNDITALNALYNTLTDPVVLS